MSHILGREGTKLGLYRDIALGLLVAGSISFGILLLLNLRSAGASALDAKLALGSFALAGVCIIVAPNKLPVVAVGLLLIASYSMTALLVRLGRGRSPITGIAEIALGATMLYFRPPAWHKSYFRLTLP